jgi:hypothetical protein
MPDFSYPIISPERDAVELSPLLPMFDLLSQLCDEDSAFWDCLDSNISIFEKQVQKYVSSLPGWETIGPNIKVSFNSDGNALDYFVDSDENTVSKFRELEYGDGGSAPQFVLRNLSLNPDYLTQIYEQTMLEVSL